MDRVAPVIDRPEISLIAEGVGPDGVSLFIGGAEGARDIEMLREFGITTVVNCAINLDINYVDAPDLRAERGKCAAGTAPVRTFKIGMVDGDGDPPRTILAGYYILEGALHQTLPDRRSYPVRRRGNILVHCRGGRSRSVALVALFLHHQQTDLYPTLADAISHVRKARELHPDEWFETPKQALIEAAQHASDAIRLLEQGR